MREVIFGHIFGRPFSSAGHLFSLTAAPLLLALLCSCAAVPDQGVNSMPDGFVYAEQAIPGIRTDIRYCSSHNFVGARIDGYKLPRCIMTCEAALALKGVQEELGRFGLGLKIFDAYRPRCAVEHFARWARRLADQKMKDEFYPEVDKRNLFKDGYVSLKSSHSRGSTVDITIVSLDPGTAGQELDMGSHFDMFSPKSHSGFMGITPAQRANRLLLRTLMIKHGFLPYPQEWWHFTLKNEPFPDTYFNFPVQ